MKEEKVTRRRRRGRMRDEEEKERKGSPFLRHLKASC